MAKNVLNIATNSLFASKSRILVTGLVLASFGITTLGLKSGMEKSNRLGVLQAGIQTCHKRLHQSLTARLLNDTKNIALESSFLNGTEECFAEAIKQMETFKEAELTKARAKLHNISSDVHWFNVNVNPGNSADNVKNPENLIQSNLNNRYKKIELAKDDVVFHLDRVEENNQSSVLYGKIAFFILLAFSVFSVAADTIIRRRELRRKEEIEGRAGKELAAGHVSAKENIEIILKDALEANAMTNCATLFTRYKTSMSLGEALVNERPTVKVASAPLMKEEEIEKIWQESEADETAVFSYDESQYLDEGTSVHLDAVLAKVVQAHSGKLFTKGIALNLKVDENNYVKGDEETIEQVLFHSLSYILSNINKDEKGAKVTIALNERGNSSVLEYQYTGRGFSVNDLKANALSGKSKSFESVELTIIDELIQTWNGELILVNQQVGLAAMKVIFRNSSKPLNQGKQEIQKKAQLVSLTKGKKKDLKLPLSVGQFN